LSLAAAGGQAGALPAADRPAGDDLVFLTVRGEGMDGDALRTVTDEGTTLWLRVASEERTLAYRDNLHVLGQEPGLQMLVIGRPERTRRATVHPLAVALPGSSADHTDLAFDRLHRSRLTSAVRGERAADLAARQAAASARTGLSAADYLETAESLLAEASWLPGDGVRP
jgi:hypothetical protein